MDYLIIVKWMTNFYDENTGELVQTIPAIITTLIDMALTFGGVSSTNGELI